MLFFALMFAFQCPDGSPPPCRQRPAAAASAGIAVFPFANRSPDSTDAYLVDALAEQIIGRLSRVPELRVKSATAVTAQWRRTPDPMASARALRVEWFVTGSVRRSGRQIAVSAELVRAASGDGAWSAPFRRGDDDIAAVEEQIAESVAVAIIGRLAPGQAASLRQGASRNAEAYRLFLYGRTLMGRRTAEDIHAAITALTQATRLDPGFAAAWSRLAYARTLQFQYGNLEGLPAESTLRLGEELLARALRLDSSNADAWQAAAMTASLRNDLGQAERYLSRARMLDSLNFEVFHSSGYQYSVDLLALPDRGEPYLRRAVALNPDFRNAWRHLALVKRNRGDLAGAEALLDTAMSFGPWPLGAAERAFIRHARGNRAGALADLANAGGGNASIPLVLVDTSRAAIIYRHGGDSSGAAAIERFEAGTGRDFESLAFLRLIRGDSAGAIAALEMMRATPDTAEARCGAAPCSVSLRTWRALHNPVLRKLERDPRYQRLLAETRPRIPW